jgi:hypothetical protein
MNFSYWILHDAYDANALIYKHGLLHRNFAERRAQASNAGEDGRPTGGMDSLNPLNVTSTGPEGKDRQGTSRDDGGRL